MLEQSENSYVKLSRKILSWEWYSEPCTRALFIHCIIKANWKPGSWKGQPYERGEFITSLNTLSKELGYSTKNIRTALEHLKRTGELASRANNKFRIITVLNYDKYQGVGKPSGNQPASNGQSAGKQLATDKEYKEYKNKKKEYNVQFERIWREYPRKKEKSAAYTAYQARLKDGYSEEELLRATIAYAEECKKTNREERYIKLGKTFFGSSMSFMDYLQMGGAGNGDEKETETGSKGQASAFYKRYLD